MKTALSSDYLRAKGFPCPSPEPYFADGYLINNCAENTSSIHDERLITRFIYLRKDYVFRCHYYKK